MKLVLDLPPAAPTLRRGAATVVTLADEVTLEIYPLRPAAELPDDVHRRGVAAGCQQEILQALEARTLTGWPIRSVLSRIERAGSFVELRLDAVYVFLVYATLVRVRATSLDRYRELRPEVLRLLVGARPDLTGDRLAGLHELWDLPATSPSSS